MTQIRRLPAPYLCYFFFAFFFGLSTAFFKAFPAENLGNFFAAIFNGALVCGLRPVLAEQSAMENVPKPISLTASPVDKEPEIAPVKPLIVLS